MRIVPLRAAHPPHRQDVVTMDEPTAFDVAEIRAAERALESALESQTGDWVLEYTADAVFDGGGDHVVEGRDALSAMAAGMQPMSSVSIRPRRTEGSESLVTVWFDASWVSGSPESGRRVDARGIILWRKEPDGRWRVAMEHLA
jgi:ketosteroid isomerase-like protein